MRRKLAIAAVITVSIALVIGCVEIDIVRAQNNTEASPIYGVTIPDGYRRWELIARALEGDPLSELRAVVGNTVAMDAYRNSTLPFPDGTVLVKLAWKRMQSAEFEPASVPGAATTVQVMVKDSKKYASSGGWVLAGSLMASQSTKRHETCFACHEARVQGHDYVFTRYAP
ncbi:cytochrome P460 family protein [Mesorhizobium sp. LNHC229A00]|uniref:cytochrome P460 family protein n=1 Tax=Mesorhizobium sp. LNHC229A00 TaxID=1287240 RepID=UPI0003CF5DE6|nr:cytochrome P460 family protein [Mesorhizobium sp. LNHC229A00]ESY86461.1 cytochrome C oxidase subunit III [Mesorhizobium sp. LNHC229A00]